MATTQPNFSPSIAEDENSIFDAPNETGSPERRLLLAVLERAILDYVGNDAREIQEATAWIFGEAEGYNDREFSFSWICKELDLDTQSISKIIAEMPKRGNHKIAPWYFAKQEAKAASDSKRGNVTHGDFSRH